ncbi:hypothetical protein LJR231_002057 [Phyllobacterium sp. LjRoot231]|uniref:hypothetical protein n=1 Tax=Phyllobacterium sp. LjRoot231 TaxID=3342289 RepID=UPI003ECCA045
MKIALHIVAAVLLVTMAVAAFYSPEGAWPLSISAIGCVFIANLDRFTEVSATTSGISAKIKDAKTKINELQNLLEVISEFQLHSLQSIGRWSSGDDDNKKYFLNRIMATLRESGFNEAKILAMKRQYWDKFVLFDYVSAVLGNGYVPEGSDAALQAEWKSLRDFNSVPSPERVREFLDKTGDTDPIRRQMLDAYTHYEMTGEHLDFDLWKKRYDVPKIKVSIP